MIEPARHGSDSVLPEPPYSTRLLADFHAGVLDSITATHVRRRLAADPRALEVLRALDRVQDELRAHGRSVPPMPEAVATRLDAVIDGLTGR